MNEEVIEVIFWIVSVVWVGFTCYKCGQVKGEAEGFINCLNNFHKPFVEKIVVDRKEE